MKTASLKSAVSIFGIALFVMLISGCDQPNTINTSTKKSRLIAVENQQLETQIDELNAEIQKSKDEIDKQKQVVEDCRAENIALQEQLQQDMGEKVKEMMIPVIEQLKQSSEENSLLKAEIEKLKAGS